MATRRTSRKTARQRQSPEKPQAAHSIYRRRLRCEPLEDRRLLATVTVTTALDTVDFSDGLTSLREALFATNLVAGPDTIDFAPALTENGPATILLTQGELDITDSLTILGPGANLLTIDASGNDPTPDQNNGNGSRVFNIDDGADGLIEVAIGGVAITGGDFRNHGAGLYSVESLTLTDAHVWGNAAIWTSVDGMSLGDGGGVYARGALVLDRVEFSGNSANRGGGVWVTVDDNSDIRITNSEFANRATQGSGGSLYVVHSGNANIVIDAILVSDSRAVGAGGAYLRHEGTGDIVVQHSTFSLNSATGTSASGGGVKIEHRGEGDVSIVDSSFSENKSQGTRATGGGVYLGHWGVGKVSIAGAIFDDNRTGGTSAEGGGVFLRHRGTGDLHVADSLISGNTTDGTTARGGGMYVHHTGSGDVSLTENSITDNTTDGTINSGGGVYLLHDGSGNVLVTGNIVSHNEAIGSSPHGMRLVIEAGNMLIASNTVTDNVGAGSGGGISVVTGTNGSIRIEDNLLARNSGGLGASSAGIVEIARNRVLDNIGTGMLLHANPGGIVRTKWNTITGNKSISAGGISLFAEQDSLITVEDTVVSHNLGGVVGGGIVATQRERSSVVIARATINHNGLTGATNPATHMRGGGVSSSNRGGSLRIDQVTISGNSASQGGGLSVNATMGGSVELLRSTVTDNHAIAGPDATSSGGGIFVQAGLLILSHSIVAGNDSATSTAPDLGLVTGTIDIDAFFSLIGDNSGSGLAEAPVGLPDANGNLIGGPIHGTIDPMLGELADNGGPTLTHALLSGSPAINAGDLSAQAGVNGVTEYDQRGEPFGRVFNGRIDIGAFEYQEASDLNLLVDALADESDGDYSRGDLSLREAIELANLWSSTDTIRFDPALTASGPATILLTTGELKITDDVSILGPGANLLTVDASGNDPTPDQNNGDGSRIFNIDDGNNADFIKVSLSGLTLTGGDVLGGGGAIFTRENTSVLDTVMTHNNSSGGGAIGAQFGVLTLTGSMISENTTPNGDGGGILADGVALNVTECLVVENVSRTGAGIQSLNGGSVAILSSTISGNVQTTVGGDPRGAGLNVAGAPVSVVDSEVSGNLGGVGMRVVGTVNITVDHSAFVNNSHGGMTLNPTGGTTTISYADVANNGGRGISVFNTGGGTTTISHSTVTGNQGNGISVRASGAGSAIAIGDSVVSANAGSDGGGIYANTSGGIALITRCTVSGNAAFNRGGGVALLSTNGGSATISESQITGNSVSNLSFSPNDDRAGGGIWVAGSGVLISDCQIIGNTSTSNGGGVFVRGLSGPGSVTIRNCDITENTAAFYGGGIRVLMGSPSLLLIEDSSLSQNSAQAGGGVFTSSPVSFVRTEIVGNIAEITSQFTGFESGNGGGVFSLDAGVTFSDCLIDQNSAQKLGGGIMNTTLSAARITTVMRSTVSNNHAENGGGIYVQIINISDSTVNGNSATESGGGIFGGGTINQTTITGNTAAVGAGLRLGIAKINNSTIAFNEATSAGAGIFLAANTLQLNHTIIARNTTPFPGVSGDISALLGATITARYSIVGSNNGSGLALAPVGSPDSNGNLIGGGTMQVNPQLAPLANNGGPTMTHALLANSPALNAGDPMAMAGQNGVPTYDQRGLPFTRVSGGRIDIGAFESQPPSGDFNFDGSVDAADYVLWRKVLTSTYPAGYGVWTTQFAQNTGSGSGGLLNQSTPLVESSSFVDETIVQDDWMPVQEAPKAKAFNALGLAEQTSIKSPTQLVGRPRLTAADAVRRNDRSLIDLIATHRASRSRPEFETGDSPPGDVSSDDTEPKSSDTLDSVFELLGSPKL